MKNKNALITALIMESASRTASANAAMDSLEKTARRRNASTTAQATESATLKRELVNAT